MKLASVFRRDQEEGSGGCWTDGGNERISANYLTKVSATVLVQSVFSGGSKCLLCPFVLPVPVPSCSDCRQGSEGPTQQASLPNSYRVFTFSCCFLTNLMIFLITCCFKRVPFYFLPALMQLAQGKRNYPRNFEGCNYTHTPTPCSEWNLQDKVLFHVLKWELERRAAWAAVCILTGPLFGQPLRKVKEGEKKGMMGSPGRKAPRGTCASTMCYSTWAPPSRHTWDRTMMAEGYL